MTSFDYVRPRSLSEAFELIQSSSDARFVAGGTDLLLRIREGKLRPKTLISLSGIEELSGVRIGEVTRIGATTRIAELIEHRELARRFPVLCDAAKTLGSTQIRNVATVGGNLINASPCADLAPPLLVHDARVVLRSASGERELTLEELFVAPGQTRLRPGELLTAVLLEAPPPARRAVFDKISRVSMDISLASVAVAFDLEDGVCRRARVAAGSVAPRPLRLIETERVLEGRELQPAVAAGAAARASEEVRPITDIRSTAEYRRHVVGVLVRRAIERLAKGETA